MSRESYEEAALFEHRFWLQIFGDHARFIYSTLAPGETEYIQRACRFIDLFDRLLAAARRPLSGQELAGLNESARQAAQEIREFKLALIREHLAERIGLGLTPTFINHMVNEVEEYLRILACLLQGEAPAPVHPINLHLLWLPDAAGHAAGIVSDLDMVEKDFLARGQCFSQAFEQLYIKAVEVCGYMRTGLRDFPALHRLNRQAATNIETFRAYLAEVLDLTRNNELLDTLIPLMPDHMDREECYYLTKLARVSEMARPDCDPARPRTES